MYIHILAPAFKHILEVRIGRCSVVGGVCAHICYRRRSGGAACFEVSAATMSFIFYFSGLGGLQTCGVWWRGGGLVYDMWRA